MIPGPVELDEEVLLALAKPLMGHRTPEFEEMLEDCWRLLRMVYRTRNEIALITGSGTAAMEAAVASVVEPGTRVLCIGGGKFGERLGEIARCFGAEVSMLEVEWGGSFAPEEVDEALSESGAEVVTLTHNETSTGVVHSAEAVGRAAREHDALFIADAITSVGGDVVETDGWGIDLCITGSQKCLAAPPGLGFVAVSERAWEWMQERKAKHAFYLDLLRYRKALKKRTTPFTPSVTLIYGLHAALRRIERETLEARIRRHRALAEATRRAAEAMGLSLLPSREHASNTVTAIRIPQGLSDDDIRGRLKREYGILVAGGQEKLKGRIFRIGHMGEVSARELLSLLACLEQVLRCSGFEVKPGTGTEAAREVLEAELGEALRACGGG
ncbi:MAG: alanine--glyoxylate aminotransferase family protein [Euryarchaeota archaeon]|nr:alanine--glyoxylate aminotransferase family protein [Euryarchaeota archaeon]